VCRLKLFESFVARKVGNNNIIRTAGSAGEDLLYDIELAAVALEEAYTDQMKENTINRVQRALRTMDAQGKTIVVQQRNGEFLSCLLWIDWHVAKDNCVVVQQFIFRLQNELAAVHAAASLRD
jgi:hypothetical protein